MANGASRLFEVMKNTGESTNNMPSQVVSLTIKSVNPLILIRDDRLEIPAEFCILYKNLNINSFRIGDIVTAIVLNDGQQYFILSNDTAEEQGANYEDLSNKPKINNVTLIGNKTSSDLSLDDYNNMNNKPSINNIELTGNKTSSDLNLDNYNNMQNKPQINGVELSGNKSAADLSLVNTSTLQQAVTNLENKINDKNIITIGLNADTAVTSATAYRIVDLNLTKQMAKAGTKLSLSNGKVLIGAGVSKVLVSGKLQTQGDANMYGLSILLNSTEISQNYTTPANASFNQISATPRLLNVSQGNTIKMGVYINVANSTKNVKAYSGNATFLTVEVVE